MTAELRFLRGMGSSCLKAVFHEEDLMMSRRENFLVQASSVRSRWHTSPPPAPLVPRQVVSHQKTRRETDLRQRWWSSACRRSHQLSSREFQIPRLLPGPLEDNNHVGYR